jgi:hypothetical protein
MYYYTLNECETIVQQNQNVLSFLESTFQLGQKTLE